MKGKVGTGQACQKIVDLLRKEGFTIRDGAQLRRTYAGHWQRSAGAWSWYLVDADGRDLNLGSQDSVSACLKHGIEVPKYSVGPFPGVSVRRVFGE